MDLNRRRVKSKSNKCNEYGSKETLAEPSSYSCTSEDDFFQPEVHALTSLNKMEEFFLKQQLTDVVLIAGDKRISAHRLVLSASSEYFTAMFTNNLNEPTKNEIDLKNVDSEAVLTCVHYCYTGTITLLQETVETLMDTACMLQLHEIVTACCNFLKKHLHPSNCIGIQEFADTHNCAELMKVADDYIIEHFLEVVENKEFLMLAPDKVAQLLASDDLNISCEEDIFHALVAWLEHDMPNRAAEITRLISFVKFPLLHPSFIVDNIESIPLFRDNLKCTELILEAFKYQLLPERYTSLISTRTLPRKSMLGALYAVGGNNINERVLSIEKYTNRMNKWTYITETTNCRLQFGVAALNDEIYVVGGRDGLKTLKGVLCYNINTKAWYQSASMLTNRHGLGVAVLKRAMYAVGGHDGWSYLNSVEKYDPQHKTWSFVKPMLSPRSSLGVAVLNEKLYAVGGRDGNYCLNTMECYNPCTNMWTSCAPMTKQRGCVGVGVLNGYIYAVGGSDVSVLAHNGGKLGCVERYNPVSDIWCLVASVSTARDGIGVCLLGERLFAVGGYDGKSYLKLVETYDQKKDQWNKTSPLTKMRAGACVVAIKLSGNDGT